MNLSSLSGIGKITSLFGGRLAQAENLYQSILLKAGMISGMAGVSSITGLGGAYRPKEWGSGNISELVYCKTNVGGLFFDAVLSVSTEHTAVVTAHPVQTGANISDHMYLEPVKITMEIGMSDAMASMVEGQWTGAYTKSISAYRKLCELQAARIPFTVLTRLNQYENMVIESISVDDSRDTYFGLRASVSLQQIIMASVATEKVSARQWTSGSGASAKEVQPIESQKTSIAAGIDPNGGTKD